jgi:hypothetical protein
MGKFPPGAICMPYGVVRSLFCLVSIEHLQTNSSGANLVRSLVRYSPSILHYTCTSRSVLLHSVPGACDCLGNGVESHDLHQSCFMSAQSSLQCMLMACSSLLTVCSSLQPNLANWVQLWLETFVHKTDYKKRAVFPITHISYSVAFLCRR